MSLTPEQRDEFARAIHAARQEGLRALYPETSFEPWDALDPSSRSVWLVAADVLSDQLAAEREAGAAEVRARVEAVLTDPEFHIETALGGSDYVREAIRAALSTEEPS